MDTRRLCPHNFGVASRDSGVWGIEDYDAVADVDFSALYCVFFLCLRGCVTIDPVNNFDFLL